MTSQSLTKYAKLSIAAAIVTISLKLLAYFLTGSIGLLSDALESFVNLAAASFALFALKIAEKPPDEEHMYGHSKAEYFSSVFEGALIVLAAVSITYAAIERIINPQVVQQAFLGITISLIAAVVNLCVALYLLQMGKKHRSITLVADGQHLLTDVWTSVGVIVGIGLVAFTHIQLLDPVIAILVAINIIFTGFQLIKESALGFMDRAISQPEKKIIEDILNSYQSIGLQYHGLLTRQAGTRRFVSVHILVPGSWTVQKGHDMLEKIEGALREAISQLTVTTHLEPLEDPKSMEDVGIDRA
ncbi:transporter [Candidatus Roizmanbacteria bacterium RIFCSPLOWO2_01_FULL_41_22]|uniref:Transporter n=2 Tax=Candidatus Roizmaniibacteriota TaxID=1752723 RepID=A0A1F7JR69_9BACT|nr:MAG: transporter [Candidatus Roizmanbacteria bacterium RIFCSPLOWO2_01_FULL_41_22]OGK58105.1 MAG: transporter [Candidatus Roizmanbacteria bacterium RIFCSPLOWO2_02_FULL_41_9]